MKNVSKVENDFASKMIDFVLYILATVLGPENPLFDNFYLCSSGWSSLFEYFVQLVFSK